MPIRFVWDARKAASNVRRHHVTFQEAIAAFFDPNAVDEHDVEHSDDEVRYNLIGQSSRRLLVVVYTELDGDTVRIISARRAGPGTGESMSNQPESNIIVVEVTEEEYQAELASGLNDDEVLLPGRHVFRRRGFLERHGIDSSQESSLPTKVRVTVELDLDVVTYLSERAAEQQEVRYDDQINDALRKVMEQENRSSWR